MRLFSFGPASEPALPDFLPWKQGSPVQLIRHPRARRYSLQLKRDGTPRLTIPRGGSRAEALRFLARCGPWLEKQLARQPRVQPWTHGSPVYYRGVTVPLQVIAQSQGVQLTLAEQGFFLPAPLPDYRTPLSAHLRALATRELPLRTLVRARELGISLSRVSVRNQKTRWGSCSARGTISLNWRLIQTPDEVIDYLIIHELMHRREMNHSTAYWRNVAAACPDYAVAERWLKIHSIILLT